MNQTIRGRLVAGWRQLPFMEFSHHIPQGMDRQPRPGGTLHSLSGLCKNPVLLRLVNQMSREEVLSILNTYFKQGLGLSNSQGG